MRVVGNDNEFREQENEEADLNSVIMFKRSYYHSHKEDDVEEEAMANDLMLFFKYVQCGHQVFEYP